MNRSMSSIDNKLSKAAEYLRAGQSKKARQLLLQVLALDGGNVAAWELLGQTALNQDEETFYHKKVFGLRSNGNEVNQRKRQYSLAPITTLVIGLLGVLFIGFSGVNLFRNTNLPSATVTAQTSCQSLIDRAILFTNNYCNQIGTNKACYGNSTIRAQMVANSSQRFSQRGDVADVSEIQSISAAPLNLTTGDWGIAIFRVLANLPGSVPGETATLMVIGNTKLDKTSDGLDSFYFSSELGQIVCDKVPFDGIFINMPDRAGWSFNVNGTELTLMGNASLKAYKNGNMEVGLYTGAGEIIYNGMSQYFGAGQKVTVALGGSNGVQVVGPPSRPEPLSSDELKDVCTVTGKYCTPNSITNVDALQAQSIVQSGQTSGSSTTVIPQPPLIIQTPFVIPTGKLIQTPVVIPTEIILNPTVPLNTPFPSNNGNGNNGNGNNGNGNNGNGNGKCKGKGNPDCP
jgi:hypothetical protein